MTKTAVVTGANSGIGLETARGLAQADYHVVLCCRSAERAAAAQADVVGSVPGASTEIVLLDLARQADVRRAAAELEQRLERLDVLVNNAGITIRKRETTDAGIDVMLAVNHLGPFLLTNLLLPLLTRSAPSRVVNVASDAHRLGRLRLDDLQAERGYGFFGLPRYAETKLMNILFTRELARRVAGTGVAVNSVHPGAIRTNLGAPPKIFGPLLGLFMKSAPQGARTSLAVSTRPDLATVSGGYFVKEQLADAKLSQTARDDMAAALLWDASAALVGLDAHA